MYELYLKYFHRKDSPVENESDTDTTNKKMNLFSKLNLRNESIPFKLSFITASGGASSMILFFLIYPTFFHRRRGITIQHGVPILMESMLRPFVRTFLISCTLSFTSAVVYCIATYESKDKKM